MKSYIKLNLPIIHLVIAIFLFSLLISFGGLANAAGSAFFSFEPTGGEIQKGNFTVSVYVNSGSVDVTTAQADISYDTTRFEFLGFNSSGTAYSSPVSETGGGGNISVVRFASPPGSSVSGKTLLTKLKFKALSAGSGQLKFQSTSAIFDKASYTNVWNGTLTTASYTVVAPASPTPKPAPTVVPSTSVSSSGGGEQTASVKQAQPTIEEQQADPDNPVPVNTDIDAETKTYLLAITIKDKNGVILANTDVRLGEEGVGQTATTDENGLVGFIGVNPGVYNIYVQTDDGEVLSSVTVTENSEDGSNLQEFEVTLNQDKTNKYLPYIIGGALLAIALAGLILYLLKRGGRGKGLSATLGQSKVSAPDDTNKGLDRIHIDVPSPDTVITPSEK